MLEPTFQFSQHSLSDFADCPRRFYLRYIAQQKWPLIETGPTGLDALKYREYLRSGALLHTLIERHFTGVETRDWRLQNADGELGIWWQRFLNTDLSDLPAQRLPELELVAPLGAYRIYARFDLLCVPSVPLTPTSPSPQPSPSERRVRNAGSTVIVDWKTLRSENPLPYRFLRDRLQTRVYLYVLATAGAPFNGGQPLQPEQCTLRYWLANFPEQPWVEINYSRQEYEADQQQLLKLIDDASKRQTEADFEKTNVEGHCTYCTYRTLCHRTGAAHAQLPDELPALLDLDNVPELDY
jgi:hypothetical protein